jgi:signal transduction histidine kinase
MGIEMFGDKQLRRLEDLALLLENHCFQEDTKQFVETDYEIRSLSVIECTGKSILAFGDKSGTFQVYDREDLDGPIIKVSCNGTIDIIRHQLIQGERSCLLFVGVRFKGIYLYRLNMGKDKIVSGAAEHIIKVEKYIPFLFPNIIFKKDGQLIKAELWMCYGDGIFQLYTCKDLDSPWKKKKEHPLPYIIRRFTIDRNVGPYGNNLFLGNSIGDIFCLPFGERNPLEFPDKRKLDERRILSVNGAFIDGMIPLSDFRKSSNAKVYPDYSGCLVKSDNKIICVYFDKDDENVITNCKKLPLRTVTKVFSIKLLGIGSLHFDGFCYTVASDVKKRLHLIKNKTDMAPEGTDIDVIFDGEIYTPHFDDRIITFEFVPHKEQGTSTLQSDYQAYLGMGGHKVQLYNVYNYETKLKKAWNIFLSIVAPSIDKKEYNNLNDQNKKEVLNSIEFILDDFRNHESKTAIKNLLLHIILCFFQNIGNEIKDKRSFLNDHKNSIMGIFYKIIEDEGRELITRFSDFLSRLEQTDTFSSEIIADLQIHLNKYVLDRKEYSQKSRRLKELWEFNEKCGNLVDALVYKGILYDKGYDPVSEIKFEEGEGDISHVVPLGKKFIVCTSKGKVFTADLEGKKAKKDLIFLYKSIIGEEPSVRISNIYFGRDKAFLMFRNGEILIFDKSSFKSLAKNPPKENSQLLDYQDKLTLPTGRNFGTSICQMPWQDEERGDDCLIGTNQGDIFYITSRGKLEIHFEEKIDHFSVTDMRSFEMKGRYFMATACWNGIVKIFECFRGENTGDQNHMIYKFNIQVDVHAVNRLHVFFKGESNFQEYPLIIAGTDSGKCYGIRLRFDKKNPEEIHHVFEWCYRCTDAIKSIHPFSLGENENYILVSAMDDHLHILQRNGISINTTELDDPLVFVYIPRGQYIANKEPEFDDGYATTVDNQLKKIRFFIKEKIMRDINECFEGKDDIYKKFQNFDREELLLKFRTIDIAVPHFINRYYLKSNVFKPIERIINEIDGILTRGNFSKESFALSALLHRLFYEHLETILNLKDPYTFEQVRGLFTRTCAHWDYEGSYNNDRAQLHWIRSLLKGLAKSKKPIDKINQWYEIGTEKGVRGPDSKEILQHFIMHPNPFLRVKSLQYLHRFIIRPEGARDKTDFNSGIVEALIESIIKVLKMHCTEASEGGPHWFELEAVRFFIWIVVNYKHTSTCPSKLCYRLWRKDIPPSFFIRLSDAVLIYNEAVERRDDIAEMFWSAGKLAKELKRDKPQFNGLFSSFTRFCGECCENKYNPDAEVIPSSCGNDFNFEFLNFFKSISLLLEFDKIDKFKNINLLKNISTITSSTYFKTTEVFGLFEELAGNIKKYYMQKYEDIYSLGTLKYTTFYDIITSLQTIKEIVGEPDENSLWVETKLYSTVLDRWENMLKEERDNNVILDFAQAIRVYNDLYNEDDTTMDMPLIFKNIFTRLNIMAECDYSYLLYLEKVNDNVLVIHNDKKNEQPLQVGHKNLGRIPSSWLGPDNFSSLGVDDIKKEFKGYKMIHMLIKTPGVELLNTSAVYLFFWDKEESEGIARLESREVLGEFITTMAYLQWAMREQKEKQEEFFRIVSHELNQMIRGALAWTNNLVLGRLENNPEKRKEYYERFNYSLNACDHIIRSILSFRDNARIELKVTDLKKEMDKVVKLARIQYKEYGNVPLNYTPPDGDFEIIADPALVGVAVMNLLSNARKYDPNQHPVDLTLSTDGSKIIIAVTDQGVGIPQNEYDIVFKKFERGAYPKENSIDGLGIGLAASKTNIELLGGTIGFLTQEGKGSKFTITLNKQAFLRSHILTSHVNIKRPPNFNAIGDLKMREKIIEKIEYNPYKKRLTLRGGLTPQQYGQLRECFKFRPDKNKAEDYNEKERKISEFNLEKLEKLYLDSNNRLKKIEGI